MDNIKYRQEFFQGEQDEISNSPLRECMTAIDYKNVTAIPLPDVKFLNRNVSSEYFILFLDFSFVLLKLQKHNTTKQKNKFILKNFINILFTPVSKFFFISISIF